LSKLSRKPADLLITGGMILPLPKNSALLDPGALAISANRIAAIGDPQKIAAEYEASRTLDASGCLVMPGLANAHTHAAMTCYRGMADDLPLMDWLNRFIFPAEAKSDGSQVYWSTLLACSEMIRSGTTLFFDMYLFEGRVADAAKEAGIRALVGEVLYDFPSPNYGPIEKGLEYSEALIERWRGDPLIRVAVEPHALYTCSPDLLIRCRDLAEKHGVPLGTHLSENRSEVEEVSGRYGFRPAAHLERLGLLSSNLIACHCVWLTEAEMDLLAKRGVRVVHNPESNLKLASGVAPIPDLLKRGVPVGLGTDGCASNNNLDLFQEMDFAAKVHKGHRLDPTAMPAETVLEMATLGSARVLGMEAEIGSLEVGKKADVIVVDLNRPHLQPVYNVVSQLVYSAVGADVRDVVIDGRIVMQNRRLLTLDEERILGRMKEIREDVKKRIASG